MSDTILRNPEPKPSEPRGRCVLAGWLHRDAYTAFQKISNVIKETPCVHVADDKLCETHANAVQALASIVTLMADGDLDRVNALMDRTVREVSEKTSFLDRLRRVAYQLSEGA